MYARQDNISWIELILILATVFTSVLLLIYLFMGLSPAELPGFIFGESLLDALRSGAARLPKTVPTKTATVVVLSAVSLRAIMKSLF